MGHEPVVRPNVDTQTPSRETALLPDFGLPGYDAGDCIAELRVIILRGDFDLGDGIEVRVNHGYALDRILIVGSIELVTSRER